VQAEPSGFAGAPQAPWLQLEAAARHSVCVQSTQLTPPEPQRVSVLPAWQYWPSKHPSQQPPS